MVFGTRLISIRDGGGFILPSVLILSRIGFIGFIVRVLTIHMFIVFGLCYQYL